MGLKELNHDSAAVSSQGVAVMTPSGSHARTIDSESKQQKGERKGKDLNISFVPGRKWLKEMKRL